MSSPIALRPADAWPVMYARLVVYGEPIPQGSMKAMPLPHPPRIAGGLCRAGRAQIVSDNPRLAAWREAVHTHALIAARTQHLAPIDTACAVTLTMYVPRPPSLPKRVLFPERSADLDKLVRSALDGITGTILGNDARVVDLHAFKRFAIDHAPCAVIAVFTR